MKRSPLELQLPSPLQYLDTQRGVEVWIKRDDLIHPEVSGNKWRKLEYHLRAFKEGAYEELLTFGGAYSNHLAAVAALGKAEGIPTAGLVRGEEVQRNATLDYCRSCGMRLLPLSRKDYALKDEPSFLQGLREQAPEAYLIPEGGKGPQGAAGCTRILEEIPADFSYQVVATSAGTGTTAAGLLMSTKAKLEVFPALKGGVFLQRAIGEHAHAYQEKFSGQRGAARRLQAQLQLRPQYHGGGYGKVTADLIDFMNDFYHSYQMKLDPIYTGKLFYGLWDLLAQQAWPSGTRIIALHTGGLQGVRGMNEKRRQKNKNTLHYV